MIGYNAHHFAMQFHVVDFGSGLEPNPDLDAGDRLSIQMVDMQDWNT